MSGNQGDQNALIDPAYHGYRVPAVLRSCLSRARVILGAAEAEIASKFVEAANIYSPSPAALQLRAMNIIYETTKERGATILIPTSMVDSMNPGLTVTVANHTAVQFLIFLVRSDLSCHK